MKLTPDTAKRVTDLFSGLSASAPGRAASVPGVEKAARSRSGPAERRPVQEQSPFERALRERKDGLSAAQDRRELATIEPAGPSADARDAADPERDDAVNADEQTAADATDQADPAQSTPAEDTSVEDADPAKRTEATLQADVAIDPQMQAILKAGGAAAAAVPGALATAAATAGGAPTTVTGAGLPATAIAPSPTGDPTASTQVTTPGGVPGGSASGGANLATGTAATDQFATVPVSSASAAPGQPAAAGDAAGTPAQAVTPSTPPTAEAVARQRAAEPVRTVDQPLTIESLNRLLLMQPDAALAPARPTVFGADPLGLVRSASRNAAGTAANAAPVNAPAAPPAANNRQASAPVPAPAPSQRSASAPSDASASGSAPTAPSAPGAPASAQPGAPAGQPTASASTASNPAASAGAARADAQPSPATPSFAAQVQRAINAVESQLRSRSNRPSAPTGRTASPASQVTPPNPASSGSVVVRLHPEGLGQMRVHLSMQGDAANLRFQVGGEQARELLASSLDSLRSALEAKGLSVDRAQVELSPSLSPVLAQPQPGQPASQPTTPAASQPDAYLRQPQADVGGQGERHGGSGNERPGSGGTDPRANPPAGDDAGLAPELLSPAPVVIDTARGRVRLTA